MFLDEPTNALDPAHRAELIGIMRCYAAAGNTLLVICHDLNLPMVLGGRVVGISSGEVFFDESARVISDVDRLKDLFGTEFVVHRQVDGERESVQLRV